MSDPFIGEIRMMPYNFTPKLWLPCLGQLLSINKYGALYALLSTKFGGNGISNFGLPDLRGRVPVHPGSCIDWGDMGGYNEIILENEEMPRHSHGISVSAEDADKDTPTPGDKTSIAITGDDTNMYVLYTSQSDLVPMGHDMGSAGAGQAHSNMQPYLAMGFFIASDGLWPSRN